MKMIYLAKEPIEETKDNPVFFLGYCGEINFSPYSVILLTRADWETHGGE